MYMYIHKCGCDSALGIWNIKTKGPNHLSKIFPGSRSAYKMIYFLLVLVLLLPNEYRHSLHGLFYNIIDTKPTFSTFISCFTPSYVLND